MSVIKDYILGCDQDCDALGQEIVARHNMIKNMKGVSQNEALYDAVGPLLNQLLHQRFEWAMFHGLSFEPYKTACQYVGTELMEKIVDEYLLREYGTGNYCTE